jgi:hypothetical protein
MDPRWFTPQQRLDELAAIVATGARRALGLGPLSGPPESSQIRLDVLAQTSVHVPARLTQTENGKGVDA